MENTQNRIEKQLAEMQSKLTRFENLAKFGTAELEKVIPQIESILKPYKVTIKEPFSNTTIDTSVIDNGLTFRGWLKIEDLERLTDEQKKNIANKVKNITGSPLAIWFSPYNTTISVHVKERK